MEWLHTFCRSYSAMHLDKMAVYRYSCMDQRDLLAYFTVENAVLKGESPEITIEGSYDASIKITRSALIYLLRNLAGTVGALLLKGGISKQCEYGSHQRYICLIVLYYVVFINHLLAFERQVFHFLLHHVYVCTAKRQLVCKFHIVGRRFPLIFCLYSYFDTYPSVAFYS